MAEYIVLEMSKYNTVTEYSAAASEIDGVIIRAGYRGYGSSGTLVKDNLFETHMEGFKDKTKIGVYWFTQAISEAEAEAEANFLYNIIKDYRIDFPVYVYSEYSNNNHDGRADNLLKSERTSYIIAFCNRMNELGYRTGIYATDSWYNSQLDIDQLYNREYSLWVERYSTSPPEYVTNYDGWQYTNGGSLTGIPGSVNLSYFYNDVAGWILYEDCIDINTVEYELEYTSTIYTGSELRPNISFYTLTEGKDYTVDYVDNIEVGIGKIVCYGIEPLYSGTITIEFTIEPKNIKEYNISLSQYNYQFNNTELEPVVSIDTLIEGVDFIVKYINNINIGSATAIATGIGNYTGEKSDIFTITPLDISNMYSYLESNVVKYTGEEVKPKMYVSELDENVEYTVSYSNNINIGKEAKATATGINNCIGNVSLFFEISDMAIEDFNPKLETLSYNYTGVEYFPKVTFSKNLIENTDYILTYEDNINAGTGKVIVQGIGTYTSTVVLTFRIEPVNISMKEIKLDKYDYKYENDFICPEFNFDDLKKDKDYRVVYSNNRNVGTAKITVTGINNYIGTVSTTFNIRYTSIQDCIAKIGTASINTIYRIDGEFNIYANKKKYDANIPLTPGIDYDIKEEKRTECNEFTLVYILVKGLNGFIDQAEYNFRVIESEPESGDYTDDGKYNFGYIDDPLSETAEGMYDFGCLDCGTDPDNISEGDYDFDKLSGMYLDKYDEDDGSNIDGDGNSKDDNIDRYPDDGKYNFGYIDDPESETAEGDYDFGCLDCGIDPDTAVIDEKDYDFNKFCHDGNDQEYESYFAAGEMFDLPGTDVYAGYHSIETSFEYKGIVYIYNSIAVNGKIRIARIEDAVESPARVLGWVKITDLLSIDIIPVGERVVVTGKIFENSDGSGSYIEKDNRIMHIKEYIDIEGTEYPYLLSNSKYGSGVGYASRDILKRESECI